MRKWVLGCIIVGGLLAIAVVICLAAGFFGLARVAQSLPTPKPTPILTTGKTYWIGALIPPAGVPEGLVIRYAILQNKPGSSINDPTITVIRFLDDATPVKLTGIRDEWCYIEALDQFGKQVEGWLECNRLLDYEPTPVPTPNLTPERP
jgi:hypothetical protein